VVKILTSKPKILLFKQILKNVLNQNIFLHWCLEVWDGEWQAFEFQDEKLGFGPRICESNLHPEKKVQTNSEMISHQILNCTIGSRYPHEYGYWDLPS